MAGRPTPLRGVSRMRSLFLAGIVFLASTAIAQSVPAAIFTDPPVDAAHPAAMTVLQAAQPQPN